MQTIQLQPPPVIFDEGETVLYKHVVTEVYAHRFPTSKSEFYMVNPAKPGATRTTKEDVSVYRNIAIEFDKIGLRAQVNLINRIELPYALATYSGGKSNHYIVSLDRPLATQEEYEKLAASVYSVVADVVDENCKNVNRMTRMPFAVRQSTGKEQSLIATGSRVSLEDLTYWLNTGPRRAPYHMHLENEIRKQLQYEENKKWRDVNGRKTIPRIYQDMIYDGTPHPEADGRHASLFKLAVWLYHNGYDDEMDELVHKAEDALGAGRNEAAKVCADVRRGR